MVKRKRTEGQTTIYKTTHKTKYGVTQTPLITRGELGCSGSACSSCFTSATRPVNLVTNPVLGHE